MTKERPILFSTPMVEAIIAGRKTQTRRVVKNIDHLSMRPRGNEYENVWSFGPNYPISPNPSGGRTRRRILLPCPYGKPGDRLWVRETWASHSDGSIEYKACNYVEYQGHAMPLPSDYRPARGWKPSIFMPRHASRITLEIINVRCEPLQTISPDDERAEGVNAGEFKPLWESINGKASWRDNPWVWVVEFKRVATECPDCGDASPTVPCAACQEWDVR